MKLRCRFLTHENSYLKLGPFLVEEKNSKPGVVLFHDFFSNHETAYIEKMGGKELERSRIGTTSLKEAGGDTTSIIRTSKQSWFFEREYKFPVTDTYTGWDNQGLFRATAMITNKTCPEYPRNVQDHLIINDLSMYRLTKRIELATSLVLDRPYASEAYQVVNYGVGGQYDVHQDSVGYHSYPGETNLISDQFNLSLTNTHYYQLFI